MFFDEERIAEVRRMILADVPLSPVAQAVSNAVQAVVKMLVPEDKKVAVNKNKN
jgi:hypothetical protein